MTSSSDPGGGNSRIPASRARLERGVSVRYTKVMCRWRYRCHSFVRRRKAMRLEQQKCNLLSVACESENSEVVEYLIDEIAGARKEVLADEENHQGEEHIVVGSGEALDLREFMERTEPRQAVFFELGSDLSASNTQADSQEHMENSV